MGYEKIGDIKTGGTGNVVMDKMERVGWKDNKTNIEVLALVKG